MPCIIDNIIYLSVKEIVSTGIPRSSVFYDIKENICNTFQSDQHGKLIEFKSLKWDWKQKINEYYDGCVRKYTQLQEIEERLGFCPTSDKDFLKDLILPKGTHLAPKKRKVYEQKCQVLNFLARLQPLTNGKAREFGVENKQEFWKLIGEFIKNKGVKLPKNARRLSDLVKKYIELGAAAVISGKWGNQNRQKIGEKELQLIIELYANREGRKFTARQVWEQFIFLAEEKGWDHCKDITYQRVADLISETRGQWHLERHGTKDFRLNQTLVINRRKASGRNLVWQLDGTPEHVWYYNPTKKTIEKLYVFKVMESRSWKIVGYSIGYTETANLVFEAIKMGVLLNGLIPPEIRSDKGSALQAAETKELMRNLGVCYYPTAAGNARGKTIEAWQKLFNSRVLTYFVNKSGGNITAKDLNSKQNPDKLKKNYKNYPTKDEFVAQIHLAMALWNKMKGRKGKSPQQLYDESEEKGRPIHVLEQFELFGIWRMRHGKIHPFPYKIEGLTLEIGGLKYRYIPDLDETEIAAFTNRHVDVSKFYVKYDPSYLEQIAIYELPSGLERKGENMRFIRHLVLKGKTSESNRDATSTELERLRKLRKVQREQERLAKEATNHRRDYLANENILVGGIELQRIHKDEYNQAEFEVQRLQMLGYNHEITSDKNKTLSELSMVDDIEWFKTDDSEEGEQDDNNVYNLPKPI